MELNTIKQAYFLGIGGIGMSAIARYFNALGLVVMGYDKTETALTKELTKEGINIHYQDLGKAIFSLELLKENCLVILTPAIPPNHLEWLWLKENGFTILKRSQVLGLITDSYKTIGVAGTHGKTTTSTLIAHILKQSQVDCAAFLGGISSNYHTNLLLNNSKNETLEQYMVVEADEFDRSFLTLHPTIGILTSSDADHLDIYGQHDELKKSFIEYIHQIKENGWVIVKKELDILPLIKRQFLTYSVQNKADIYAKNIEINGDEYSFDLHFKDVTIHQLKLGIPGLHNVENAVAASAACLLSGVSHDELRKGLESFAGVKRRFEYIIKTSQFNFIDDYAHHPEELRAIISSIKNMYSTRKIVAVFQPHLYSRTRDFADEFAESLSLLDNIVLLDIYPARELPIDGITSQIIFNKMTSPVKVLCTKNEAIAELLKMEPEILLTLGAGDIDQLVIPLKNIFNHY